MLPEHPPEFPLAVHDLTVAYHRKPVLWDVDLNIPEGSLTGIVGPNGAGKSTLLKACLDLIPKTSGEALVYGKTYEEQRDLIAYVPQRESVDWDFPISAPLEALEQVGIAHLADRQISQLSGGQQQRVFLARALVQDAQIYFMDEPFAAVDAATEQAIIELLQSLNARGKTVLCVHHDLATVSRYFNHLVLLNMRVVANGPTSETFTRENLQKTYGGKLNLLDDVAQALKNVGRH